MTWMWASLGAVALIVGHGLLLVLIMVMRQRFRR